ncbi:hypothetical protein BN1708_003846, partial [Verticillium longisporum]
TLTTSFYLCFGVFCYYRHFDRASKDQTRFRSSQIRDEIADSLCTLFWGSMLTAPVFTAQIRGYSKIYPLGSASWWYEMAQYPLFLLFSDTWMYWMHRIFHIPLLFRALHSKHHRYVIPTPFSAYAFHPLEAWIMSLATYAYSFIWPMSDVAQVIVFCTANVWTFLLHDDRDHFHTVHHKNIKLNFGQYMSLWDKVGGTYVNPKTFFQHKPGADRK